MKNQPYTSNLETKMSPLLPLANTSKKDHREHKTSTAKISEIPKYLLSQDQHIENY
jgi:hypothetical protein